MPAPPDASDPTVVLDTGVVGAPARGTAPDGVADPPQSTGVVGTGDAPPVDAEGSAEADDQVPAGPSTDWWTYARGAFTLLVVAGATAFVLAQLQPQLVFSDTTPAGGDMGAHVWSPAYLRDHLLVHGRLSGWTPDWYAGFPAMQFYMVVPMLAIVALSTLVPYGVAFKVVTVAGVVTLPLSAYTFGRLNRLPFPVPALLSVAAATFVFDRGFSIYGGNAASTLAGEFAFAISLSLAVLTLGVVGRGLAEGSHRALAAGLLALTGLCHLIPAFFALTGTVVWFLLWLGRDTYEATGSLAPDRWSTWWAATRARLWWLVSVGPVAAMLAAFWVLPFYAKSRYLNDMGWQKDVRYTDFLFWRQQLGGGGLVDYPTLAGVLALALVGLAVSLALRNRSGLLFAGVALVAAIAFRYIPQGRLWNTRLLPFYYLCLLLLAAVGVGLLPELLRRPHARRRVGLVAGVATLGLQLALVTEPRSGLWFDTLTWGDRWAPYVVVGVLLVTLIGAAELVDSALARASSGRLGPGGRLRAPPGGDAPRTGHPHGARAPDVGRRGTAARRRRRGDGAGRRPRPGARRVRLGPRRPPLRWRGAGGGGGVRLPGPAPALARRPRLHVGW